MTHPTHDAFTHVPPRHPCDEPNRPLYLKERLEMASLLAKNPNYFANNPEVDLPAVLPIKTNTTYEELTCVGLWPEANLIEATLAVKLPFGFLGKMCEKGSEEYVRFFIDWNGDGDFTDPDEDLGVAQLNVHDIPEVKKHHLCYALRLRFKPRLSHCKEPYIVRLRAILSWQQVPTGPNFVPVWGNILESWVQIDPVKGTVVGVPNPGVAAQELAADKLERATRVQRAEPERHQFLSLLAKNPNHFGTLQASSLAAVKPIAYDTSYEELKCIGLYPERDFLEAVIEIKRPYGFIGDLCQGGSKEYVRFFLDWNGDGDFIDFAEDEGVAAVAVHDIPAAAKVRLSYALGRKFRPLRASCQAPRIVKLRAILSWNQVPTGPNFVPVWGNVLECWVQVRPTEGTPEVLIGQIDGPLAGACATPVVVPACTTGAGPLQGLRIVGSAGGAPFTSYTLRYSWGANPPVNTAVVYPDCTRATSSPSSAVPVLGGTLGYLDATLLPPGETTFTVYLDVFGGGTISVSRTFQVRTEAVEITEVATVKALVAEDPFHPGSFTKLIKATNDSNPAVPEVSVGGAFSVTGSAYVTGCDRILSQYVVARFSAPPAFPVPVFADATLGTPIIAPVVYDDTPAHPWQSGCIGVITPNTILNGNLVAFWSKRNCSFLGIDYQVDKVEKVPFWSSAGLNGRFVLLVEARDRLLPLGPFPGDVAGKDQVVVWIDNRIPVAEIHSIGGISGCGDLHLKDFVGTTAEIKGVAWDPPIDATAPAARPNDNFGQYQLGFQRNGDPLASGSIAGATPTTRVPNLFVAALPAGAEGVLAHWDIVGALDGGTGPLPPNSPKLKRGERCAYVITLSVNDTTHVGDSGSNHVTGPVMYAINVINDL